MNYDQLTIAIQKCLFSHIERGDLSLMDGAIILHILSLAESEEQMRDWLEKMQTQVSFLDEIIGKEKSNFHDDLEQIVQNFVKDIIHDDPLLAAQVSGTAMQKDMSIDTLKELYPSFENYLRSHSSNS